jgi:hypothetical protein
MDDAQAATALTFIFGAEQRYYEDDRVVWGKTLRLRVLGGEETVVCDLTADQLLSPRAVALERDVQYLGRALLSIDGRPFEGAGYPEAADEETRLNCRLEEIRRWPALLTGTVADKWREVMADYRALLDPETVKN